MKNCLCGQLVDEKHAQCPRCEALQVLELGMDAAESAIREAYRTMVKVWHPDRFQNDEKMKASAESKLKDINAAFDFLISTSSDFSRTRRPEYSSTDQAKQSAAPQPESAAKEETKRPAASAASIPIVIPPSRLHQAIKICWKVTALALVFLLGRYIWIALDIENPAREKAIRLYGDNREGFLKTFELPKKRLLRAVEQDLHTINPHLAAPAPEEPSQQTTSTAPEAVPPASQSTKQQMKKTQPTQTDLQQSQSANLKLKPYITVGSTQAEVLAQQGTPTSATADKLVYGRSELYLKNGVIVGWRIDPVASPMRVKLWPDAPVDTSLKSYSIGSSKDVVLVVQGTPTAFTQDKYEYGSSVVYFRDNQVINWKNDPASIHLRVR
jgi:hypothetical protein